MPNPTAEKLYEGSRRAKDDNVDLSLVVGGSSVITMAYKENLINWRDIHEHINFTKFVG